VERQTSDKVFGGRVVVHQPARGHGYRVNADALLLADFAGASSGVVYDLGAGVGAVALVLLVRGLASRAVLVDSDEAACGLARKNLVANAVEAAVVLGDVLDGLRAHAGRAAVVVCNPPYFDPAGRPSRSAARARAGDVERFIQATRHVLGRRGRGCFVYPAAALAKLLATFRAHGLEPKRLRFVHPRAGAPARVVLVEVRATKPGGLVTLPPLVERDGPRHGDYTEEVARALGLRA
jgi:tRNA1Val (adenine37-N6)-methyltransferase